MAGPSPPPPSAESKPSRPAWAGGGPMTTAVNALIGFEPLYKIIRNQAKQTLVKTAEKKGVPWNQMRSDLEQAGIQDSYENFVDQDLEYPDYYLNAFHGYPEGNLCWQAAFETEAATLAVSLRVWKDEPDLSPSVAWRRIRDPLHEKVRELCPEILSADTTEVLDIGCSVGMSTEYLREYLLANRAADAPPFNLTGLDLSPYMLAVAAHRTREKGIDDITWVHAAAEAMPYEDASMDLVSIQYVIHELPTHATKSMMAEVARVLRPGGCVFLTDNDPGSATIQNLPAPIFTMMKSTEPYSDQYYLLDMSEVVEQAGFDLLFHGPSDHRHRAIVARKPL